MIEYSVDDIYIICLLVKLSADSTFHRGVIHKKVLRRMQEMGIQDRYIRVRYQKQPFHLD